MRRFLAIAPALLLGLSLWAQQASPRFRILEAGNPDKLLEALNHAGTENYRVVASTGSSMLMEMSTPQEPGEGYKYALGPKSYVPGEIREQLNLFGARGYRLIGGVAPGSYPTASLLLEKATGRPNQFQYLLADSHHIARTKLWIKDDFSAGPTLIADAAAKGYRPAGLTGLMIVLEKAAEPTEANAPCARPECYAIITLDTRHADSVLTDAGQRGLRFMAGGPRATFSGTGALVLMAKDGSDRRYEYRVVPRKHKDMAAAVETASKDGFCARAAFDDYVLMERSGSRRCRARVLVGDAATAAAQMEKATVDGFRPVLLVPEVHAGFTKVTVTYAIVAERAEENP